ncbi:recombinase family protein [Streptomyces scopuliridis]|uniref:recombinase family protein n=1 Tax=Streptomyces scopuliridis TaxID=452529 RepID=UPI00369C4FC8
MPRLFGFEDTAHRRLRETEAAAIRQAASRFLVQQSFPGITEWLNDEGHRTTRGGKFRPATVAGILDNPAIAGLAEDEQGNLYETGGPQIITPDEFKQIRAMRKAKQEGRSRQEQRDHLFTGTDAADCGLCGILLTAAPSNSGSRGYRCAKHTAQHPGGCGKIRINADALEAYVGEHVLAELAKPEVKAQLLVAREQMLSEAAELRKQATEDRKKQQELGEQYAESSGMSLAAFKSADKNLSKRIRETSAEARRLEQVRHAPLGGVPDLVKWWKHAPLAGQRGVVVLLLEKVTVYPAASRGSRTVDSARVSLRWKKWGSLPTAEKAA